MSNHLKNQVSPYLLQHVENPVDWYPWGNAAFDKAKAEDKPIFLSIGYSTCHWCHVMAHESFEDVNTANYLNEHFVSIKVDREERPDIDSIYMTVCQAFTGSGGWPMSIFMTAEQKPFFAGTYFPADRTFQGTSFLDLLSVIVDKWQSNREGLLQSAEGILRALRGQNAGNGQDDKIPLKADCLIEKAEQLYEQNYDKVYGGFGRAPKFPTPHNLLFLLKQYEKTKKESLLQMTEQTLRQMYRGGIFDHVGYGFSRYSTDAYFLVPHFEKMLYDNALLILAYCKAYGITRKTCYLEIAQKTAHYIRLEMSHEEGGFYSAQDADSEGEEGKYYTFTPAEITGILGEEKGTEFCTCYNITPTGNFEGKSIPNLLQTKIDENNKLENFQKEKENIYDYRKKRYELHLDDKILTAWNGLMIAAFCQLYRNSSNENYLKTAICAEKFIQSKLCKDGVLYASYRNGVLGAKGFLEDYANEIFALLNLYEATLQKAYLKDAVYFCKKVIADFFDEKQGGFYLYGKEEEHLILRPKETYDGAMPSGNSMMAYNLVRLCLLTEDVELEEVRKKQIAFCSSKAAEYPAGYGMFLCALSDDWNPPETVTVVCKKGRQEEERIKLPFRTEEDRIIRLYEEGEQGYSLVNNRTTYYVCKNHTCNPPLNHL